MFEEVFQSVAAIFAEADHPIQMSQLDTGFRDLGVDSFEAIQMLVSAEERFGLTLPDNEFASIETPRQLVNKIVEKVKSS